MQKEKQKQRQREKQIERQREKQIERQRENQIEIERENQIERQSEDQIERQREDQIKKLKENKRKKPIENQIENQRIVYLDLLRIFAIFSMMFLHLSASNWSTISTNTFEWHTFNVYNSLVRFCVPVFVMISGVLFLDDRRPVEIKELYSYNIYRIVRTFFFWSFLYASFTTIKQIVEKEGDTGITLISDFATKLISGHYHMWYLYTIMGLYIITPLLRRISADKKLTEYFLCMSFLFCYFINLLKITPIGGIINVVMDKACINFIMGYTGYYLLGYYLHRYKISKAFNSLINKLAILSIVITIIGTSLYSNYKGEARLEFYGYLLPTTFFVSAAVFLLFKNAFSDKRFKPEKIRSISKLSSLTFGMYLIHVFINMLLTGIGLSTLSFNPILSVPIITIIVFLLSMLATYGISKVPFLNKFII